MHKVYEHPARVSGGFVLGNAVNTSEGTGSTRLNGSTTPRSLILRYSADLSHFLKAPVNGRVARAREVQNLAGAEVEKIGQIRSTKPQQI